MAASTTLCRRFSAASVSLKSQTVSDHEMTRAVALRWLVHLLGDLHQPPHLGSGYYRFDAQRQAPPSTDPHSGAGKDEDRRQSVIYCKAEEQLHAFLG